MGRIIHWPCFLLTFVAVLAISVLFYDLDLRRLDQPEMSRTTRFTFVVVPRGRFIFPVTSLIDGVQGAGLELYPPAHKTPQYTLGERLVLEINVNDSVVLWIITQCHVAIRSQDRGTGERVLWLLPFGVNAVLKTCN